MRISLFQFILAALSNVGRIHTRPMYYHTFEEGRLDSVKYGLDIYADSSDDGGFYVVFTGDKDSVCRYMFNEIDILENPQEVIELLRINGFDMDL